MNKKGVHIAIPTDPLSSAEIKNEISIRRKSDLDWKSGKAFCLMYDPGEETRALIKESYNEFFSENALNPTSFPSLRKMESEVVSMILNLMNAPDAAAGTMTSGGTESILMSVLVARKVSSVDRPNIILATTAHPAFHKAAEYFGFEIKTVEVNASFKLEAKEVEKQIDANTVLLVGSAPSYPHGTIDELEAIGEVAIKSELLFHVDACIGGMMLPFLPNQSALPIYDFEIPGVTSISVDLHKYGFSSKGASVILYRTKELRRKQFSIYTKWPGGIYGSPSMAGSRPGGTIAAAWTALNCIGLSGYREHAARALSVTNKVKRYVSDHPELELLGNPDMTIVAFKCKRVNVYELADELNIQGWHFERLQDPAGIHLTIGSWHENVVDDFFRDLEISILTASKRSLAGITNAVKLEVVKRLMAILPDGFIAKIQNQFSGSAKPAERTAPMYGMIGALKGTGDLDEIILDILDKLNSIEE